MRNRAHPGRSSGWNSAPVRGTWRRGLVAVTAGAVSMAILACAVALARETSGHDWYAAYKVTLADLLIGAGFDGDVPVEYRNEKGAVETLSRYSLSFRFEARWAREDILEAAREGAALGALYGFGGALLCLALVGRSGGDRRDRRPASGPAPERRREARVPSASIQEQPMSVPRPAPAHGQPDRPPVSSLPPPAKPEPGVARQVGAEAAGDNGTAPAEPRKRTYGRWV